MLRSFFVCNLAPASVEKRRSSQLAVLEHPKLLLFL
jgi:hypothetical protein